MVYWGRNQKGGFSFKAALMLFVLFLLFIGIFEFSRYFLHQYKLNEATSVVY